MLLHDNVQVHKAPVSQAALCTSGFVEINDPPYPADLAPGDFLLFTSLKEFLYGGGFVDEADLRHTVPAWFGSHSELFVEEASLNYKSTTPVCHGLIVTEDTLSKLDPLEKLSAFSRAKLFDRPGTFVIKLC